MPNQSLRSLKEIKQTNTQANILDDFVRVLCVNRILESLLAGLAEIGRRDLD
jgi:hypothetical protein